MGDERAAVSDELWIPWTGGECPVDPWTLVIVRFRGSERIGQPLSRRPRAAKVYNWQHHGSGGDIIAYRESPALSPTRDIGDGHDR